MTISPELIAIIAFGFTVTASIAAAAYALGNLPKRKEYDELRQDVNDRIDRSSKETKQDVNDLRQEFAELRQDVNDKIDRSNRELRQEFAELRQDVDRSNRELRQEFAELRQDVNRSNRELRQEFAELRQDVNRSNIEMEQRFSELRQDVNRSNGELKEELVAEIRRSHQQLIRALVNHRHLEPDGAPIFTEPPDVELVAADD